MTQIKVVHPNDAGWEMAPGPGGNGSKTGQLEAYTSPDGRFTTGLWWREPDEWVFERAYDEVAFITGGEADIEFEDGSVFTLGAGDVMVTPFGTKGTWRVRERVTKLYAIYEGPGQLTGAPAARLGAAADKSWVVLPTEPEDPNAPGEEWYAFRSGDEQFSTGVWKRVPETGPVDKDADEVSILIRGDVAIDIAGGAVVTAGPGDVLVTAKGCRGTWRAQSFVEKFWAVYHG
ncbi:MAG: cupin domain-containing protein [Actinomycetota bacterium]